MRNLKGRPPASDVFGKRGRRWLAGLELPVDERDTLAACLRQIDFLDAEIAGVDEHLAKHALDSPEIKRLMTIPGIDVTTAATLIAAIGAIHRFESAKRLVGYLGLDARVRQSGVAVARHGRISKEGTSAARHVLVQAAWAAIKTPGPLRAFYQRIRARRGAQIAIVAVARKLAMLCWQLLTREQDYAYQRPSSNYAPAQRTRAPPQARPSPALQRSGPLRNANSPNTPSSPTGASSPTGKRPAPTRVRAPHRGARHKGRQATKQRGRHQPQNLRFSSRSPAHQQRSQTAKKSSIAP